MENFSPEAWIAILGGVATLIIGGAAAIISVLLGCLTWLAKVFFDDASAKLAELPAIKEELTETRYTRQGDRKDIDRAHSRLDGHDLEFTHIRGKLPADTKVESATKVSE